MPIETPLNVAPYSDDYAEEKDFHRILFKNRVAVQTRELNQLQTILKKQIERFGDSVFKRGTIVEGCNFIFKDSYPYIKIGDTDSDGRVIIPSSLAGTFAVSSNTGLKAFVQDYADGFAATDPDTKTLYLRYLNSGNNSNTFAFVPGETISLFDSNTSITRVRVDNGGLGFSNSDRIVTTSALVVNVSTGTFSNGEYVTQEELGSNLQIIWIDDTTLALEGQVILGLKPRNVDLANSAANSNMWATANAVSIRNSGNTAVGVVEEIIGTGTEGVVRTDGSGRVVNVSFFSQGTGYTNTPHISVRSSNNVSGLTALSIAPINYVSRLQIRAGANSVGNGYAFGVTGGVIYQKGEFIRVSPQSIIVSKYDQSPDGVVVGFTSREEIVDFAQDPSLNDPLAGGNFSAPGADRLKITAELEVANKDDVTPGDNFFTIVEWNEGKASRINQVTVYSRLGDEMARRTYEAEGDFVLDRFEVTTRSPASHSDEGEKLSVVVDPGIAYVSGYRVETSKNYAIDISKGLDSKLVEDRFISLNYGGYVRISEVAGNFLFSTGDLVSLRSAASTAVTLRSGSITGAGDQIGTARIRSMVRESGTPGTPGAIYRLYLFDIRMTSGKNFRQVRSLFYDGTLKGVGDCVLELDPTTEVNVAVLKEGGKSQMIFASGVESLKNANQASYIYRGQDYATAISNTGLIVKSLASDPTEFFIKTGSLSQSDLAEIYVAPVSTIRSNVALTGTLSLSTTSANATGSGTAFISEIQVGDHLSLSGNSTENTVRRVVSVVNNTVLTLDSNSAFTNTAAVGRLAYPAHLPIPLGSRAAITGNVDSNGNILTINLGAAVVAGANVVMSYDVEKRGAVPGTKTASRNRFVKIATANNEGGTVGPWCLGIADAFRLRNVYVGTSSSVNTSDLNAVDDFYIDPNHRSDYADLSWLYAKPDSTISLSSGDWLLVEFDHFNVDTTGFFTTPSYVTANAEQVAVVDGTELGSLGSSIHSAEIPSIDIDGKVVGMNSLLDFRPIAANTAASTTTVASATINPSSTLSFGDTSNPTNNRRFPKPDGRMEADVEHYMGRKDSVIIGYDGNISIIKGVPATNRDKRLAPQKPNDSLLLDIIDVAPYPTLPVNASDELEEILNVRTISGASRTELMATTSLTGTRRELAQPRRNTQADIGSMARRIQNLEYYSALSFLETKVKDRVIPSSLDGSINRFKFGFFVDDFDDEALVASGDSRHTAKVANSALIPASTNWRITHGRDWPLPPYVDHLVVEQDYATGGPINACVQTIEVSNTIIYAQQTDRTLRGSNNPPDGFNYLQTRTVTMADVPGQVDFFFENFSAPDRIQIYQGNTLFKTANSSVVLTTAEKTLIKGNTFNRWFEGNRLIDRTQRTGEYWINAGKISWNHDPALGKTYTIMVGKGTGSIIWRYAMRYPVSSTVITCPPTPGGNTGGPIDYTGTIRVPKYSRNSKSYEHLYIDVEVTGLRPSTVHSIEAIGRPIHRISMNGVNVTNITTDASGKAKFTLIIKTYHNVFTLPLKMEAPQSKAEGRFPIKIATPVADNNMQNGPSNDTGGLSSEGPTSGR